MRPARPPRCGIRIGNISRRRRWSAGHRCRARPGQARYPSGAHDRDDCVVAVGLHPREEHFHATARLRSHCRIDNAQVVGSIFASALARARRSVGAIDIRWDIVAVAATTIPRDFTVAPPQRHERRRICNPRCARTFLERKDLKRG